MSAEIDMSNNRANMAYAVNGPWHGLGKCLTPDADLETWRREAGMEWEVQASDLTYTDHDGNPHIFNSRVVLFRSDTKYPLGVVSTDYCVVQPAEVMEFFRDLLSGRGFKMETAGCLFGGRKFWALAKTGKVERIMGIDEVAPYLLVATSCDGSMATAAHFTSVRVVCNNTLRMAIGERAEKARIRVPHNSQLDVEAVKAQLGVAKDAWANFMASANQLAQLKLGRNDAIQVVADQLKGEWVTPEGDDMSPDQMVESSNVLRRIMALYDGEGIGAQLRTAHGTAWGLVNAVTQYFDHEVVSRGDNSRAFERAHITDRAAFKTRVADALLEMV